MKPTLAIFLGGLCLTLAVRISHPETMDEVLPVYSAISLLDHGDLDIPLTETYHPYFYRTSPDGKLYPKFGPGQAFILAPLVAAGRLFASRGDPGMIDVRPMIQSCLFFGSLVVPILAVMAFRFWMKLGYSQQVSAVSAVLLMATSELLPYSRSLFGDLSCAFLAFGAFCAIGSMTEKSLIAPASAGVFLGLSALVRPVTILFLAPFALYMLLVWKRRATSPGGMVRQLLCAFLPFALLCFSFLLFNRHAFGSFFSSGYESEMFLFDLPFSVGAPHILFSFEKGFFVYSPSVIISLIFWRRFHRSHPQESMCAILFASLYVYVYASWYASSGGNELSYGQRFLLPVLPLAYLALPESLGRLSASGAPGAGVSDAGRLSASGAPGAGVSDAGRLSASGAGRISDSGILIAAGFAISFLVQIFGCLQTADAFRSWAAQFEFPPAPPYGYLLKSLENPSSIALWWWQTGGPAVLLGPVLAVTAIYFFFRATRPPIFPSSQSPGVPLSRGRLHEL